MNIHVYFIQGKHGVIRAKPLILVFMHLFDEESKTCLPSAPPGKYFKKTNQATNCASSQAGHCLAPNRSASETWQLHLVQMWM